MGGGLLAGGDGSLRKAARHVDELMTQGGRCVAGLGHVVSELLTCT